MNSCRCALELDPNGCLEVPESFRTKDFAPSNASWEVAAPVNSAISFTGLANGIRACWFALKERTRAFFSGYPLDVYVLDSERPLDKLRADESPIVLDGGESLDLPL
jgi:hypothetical protein